MVDFGIHQIVRPQAWTDYVPDPIDEALPLSTEAKMRLHGLGNISLGSLFLLMNGAPAIRWAVTGWWMVVTPVCWWHGWKEGLRDLTILLGLVSFVHDQSTAEARF